MTGGSARVRAERSGERASATSMGARGDSGGLLKYYVILTLGARGCRPQQSLTPATGSGPLRGELLPREKSTANADFGHDECFPGQLPPEELMADGFLPNDRRREPESCRPEQPGAGASGTSRTRALREDRRPYSTSG